MKFKMTAECNPSKSDNWFAGFIDGAEFDAIDHNAAQAWLNDMCISSGTDSDPHYLCYGPIAVDV